MSIRALTITGEAAMDKAALDARAILDDHENEIIRSYAATGILMVALAEVTSGVAKECAIETLRGMLQELGGLPS
jgi:fructoselysine-6-P-deglycase FrlB-like protein